MNRKRITIILLVFVPLIAGGIFLWGQRTDTKSNESGSINDNITQDKGVDENDVKQNDKQEENELPIISPSPDSRDEMKNGTKNETAEDETSKDNSENGSEDTSKPDDNLDMELPFVPAD